MPEGVVDVFSGGDDMKNEMIIDAYLNKALFYILFLLNRLI